MEEQAADDRLWSHLLNQEQRRELTSKASQGLSNRWAQANINLSAIQHCKPLAGLLCPKSTARNSSEQIGRSRTIFIHH